MRCPKCGADNRKGATFCGTCGTSLGIVQRDLSTHKLANQDSAPAASPGSAPRRPQTHPVIAAGPEAMVKNVTIAPLPAGALLEHRRYEVINNISAGGKLNVYAAWGSEEYKSCPQCGYGQNTLDSKFCQECSTDLSNVPATQQRYTIKESADKQIFANERQVVQRKLRHPHIIHLYDAFEYTPYKPPRTYLVSEDTRMLAPLSAPQHENQILQWGIQLANALAYLHQHGVAHRNVQVGNVRVNAQGQAILTNFNQAYHAPANGATPEAQRNYIADVKQLADMLHGLLTGGRQGAPIPPDVVPVFNRARSAEGQPYTAQELSVDLQAVLAARRKPPSLNFFTGHLSDVGEERQLNEDSLLTMELEQTTESVNQPVGLYVVADGMGGHEGGEVASRLVIKTLADRALRGVLAAHLQPEPPAPPDYGALLKDAVQEANKLVYERRRAARNDMGSTVVAALVVGEMATIANVGDSRAYLINSEAIKQITVDHSLVERLVATGQITAEEARVHPQKNVIYRTIGDKPQVETDIYTQKLQRGDKLLLCSDGLSGMVADGHISSTVGSITDPQEACKELVRMANDAGGEDNISVIIVEVRK